MNAALVYGDGFCIELKGKAEKENQKNKNTKSGFHCGHQVLKFLISEVDYYKSSKQIKFNKNQRMEARTGTQLKCATNK